MLCDPDAGDFHLHADSPCLADCGVIGAWPVECGVVQVETTTWGAVKAMFG